MNTNQAPHRQASPAPVPATTTVTPCAEPVQPTREKGTKSDSRKQEE
jgi:hypothetical protein